MVINPGSTHFDAVDAAPTYGTPLVTYSNYPNAATTVASLSNNPTVVLS